MSGNGQFWLVSYNQSNLYWFGGNILLLVSLVFCCCFSLVTIRIVNFTRIDQNCKWWVGGAVFHSLVTIRIVNLPDQTKIGLFTGLDQTRALGGGGGECMHSCNIYLVLEILCHTDPSAWHSGWTKIRLLFGTI